MPPFLVVKKGSKIRCLSSVETPGPWSTTSPSGSMNAATMQPSTSPAAGERTFSCFRKFGTRPSMEVALVSAAQANISFEAFFTHILMHELVHGIGPQTITVEGRETTVREALKEVRAPLEEAKADICGLWAMQQLVDKGVLDASYERTMYTTFLASSFRSIRRRVTVPPHQSGSISLLKPLAK